MTNSHQLPLNIFTVRSYGPFFIPKYQGMGKQCWEKGCDKKEAEDMCEKSVETSNQGKLAIIDTKFENYQVGKLLRPFGKFNPWEDTKTYFWFYNSLKEEKINFWDSTYTWLNGREANFTNWYVIHSAYLNYRQTSSFYIKMCKFNFTVI